MSLLRKKRTGFYAHGYAYLISGAVIVSLVYTLYSGDDGVNAAIDVNAIVDDPYSASAILSNDFNYGVGKVPKPDAYTAEVNVTTPKWLSLEPSPQNLATPSQATPSQATPSQATPSQATPKQTADAVVAAVASSPSFSGVFYQQSNRPRIAIIIDDMGVRQSMTKPFAALPMAINFSFLPYAEGLSWQVKLMQNSGHELMLHIPMEPSIENQNPGPMALLTSLNTKTIDEYLNWNLARFDGFVGINNHMGSRFTENAALMARVIERLKKDNLFFIDSRTSSKSTGYAIAKEHGLKYEGRDVFLDNILTKEAIFSQFAELERLAQQNGSAIAIGHPHRETLLALQAWLPTLEARGFNVVKVSALLKQEQSLDDILLTHVQTDTQPQKEQVGYLGGGN
jgi:hypothetical protein